MQQERAIPENRPPREHVYRFLDAAKLDRRESALSLWGAIGSTGLRAATESVGSIIGAILSNFAAMPGSTGFFASYRSIRSWSPIWVRLRKMVWAGNSRTLSA